MTTPTALVGALVNVTNSNNFYCALSNSIPSTWSSSVTGAFNMLQNDGRPFSFDNSGKYRYLSIVMPPSGTAITGSGITFDINALLGSYAVSTTGTSFDSNLVLYVCDSYNPITKVFNTNGSPVQAGKSTAPAQQMYCTLNNYDLMNVTGVVTAFPYTLGMMNSGAMFAVADATTGIVGLTSPPKGVIVKVSHTPISMLGWGVILILVFIFLAVVIGIIRHFYKKRKMASPSV